LYIYYDQYVNHSFTFFIALSFPSYLVANFFSSLTYLWS
jgi:hypothetical protein